MTGLRGAVRSGVLVAAVAAAGPLTVLAQSPASLPTGGSRPQLRTLDNGAELLLMEDPSQPTVAVNLVFRGGTSTDPERLAGLASLTASVLTHSTRNRTRGQIQQEMDALGVRMAATADLDYTLVSLETPVRHLDGALDLLADVVLQPVIPADQLAMAAGRAANALQRQAASLPVQASRAFTRAVFGPHPYGRVETSRSLQRIDVQDAIRYHRDFFRPNNAAFVVAGGASTDRVEAALRERFGAWESAPVSLPGYHGLPGPQDTRVVLVHVPGAVEAVVRAGHAVMSGGHRDWPALGLAVRLLGGDGPSRLSEALELWTEDAGAGLARNADAGVFQVRLTAPAGAVDTVVATVLDQVRRATAEPPNAGALERERTRMLDELARAPDTPVQQANQVTGALLMDRGWEDLAGRAQALAGLSADQVAAAARAHLRPDHMVVVVAGDALEIHDRLAGVAPVTVVDPGGRTLAMDDLRPRARTVELDGSVLEPGEWTYEIQVQGRAVGEVERRLEAGTEAGTLRLTSRSRMGPQTLDREVTFREADLAPLSGVDRIRAQGQEVVASLEVSGDSVRGYLEASGAPRRPVEGEVLPGALVGEMVEAALWAADLKVGSGFALPVVGQDGRVSNVRARVVGQGPVTVPAGTFQAYEVELEGEAGLQQVFVTVDRPRYTVQVRLRDQPVVTSLTWTGTGSP